MEEILGNNQNNRQPEHHSSVHFLFIKYNILWHGWDIQQGHYSLCSLLKLGLCRGKKNNKKHTMIWDYNFEFLLKIKQYKFIENSIRKKNTINSNWYDQTDRSSKIETEPVSNKSFVFPRVTLFAIYRHWKRFSGSSSLQKQRDKYSWRGILKLSQSKNGCIISTSDFYTRRAANPEHKSRMFMMKVSSDSLTVFLNQYELNIKITLSTLSFKSTYGNERARVTGKNTYITFCKPLNWKQLVESPWIVRN